ncbi:prepilin peptidase [Cellulomonas dongxiuzhuiae]|uniref:Prepilin leader peptidase/N-methyltransferase n=2 Tax=Cellulomonas dongxiuzhuiae TaxID=2819979 RepID=A0ABX8GP61_9CELL|nr:A24 family peptidase [Cellulomonas dongxiuzhuiae]MBO3087204.1 prepilin peptidase [Cellulomonas dongxiuzhuiae]MBO3090125.1 prepilin peptidase [Cellulomonas dongxiuzhuiae]MBO3093399.1 prepilin peptidase [Cellulomonas dongxiuzhuiae]QWC17850.1 prepilin peptidase [Cellulomonas dongxiuzhuiae]
MVVGSFLNVVVWRVPRGESVVRPPSACPTCRARIVWYDNVPVVSWLVLRGRCRRCAARISVRYPVVELVTGLLFVGTALVVGWTLALPAFLYLVSISVALAAIDVDVHRLPDAIVLPSYAVAGVLLVLASWTPGEGVDTDALVRAAAGSGALFLLYLVLALIHPRGMGLGDLKLSGVLGLYLGWVGWGALAVGAFAAFLLGGLYGVVLMVAGRAGRKTQVPFGPWMLLGAVLGVVVGEPLAAWYIRIAV